MAGVPGIGQSIGYVTRGAGNFIDNYSDLTNVSIEIISGLYDRDETVSQINKGNPIILGYNPLEAGEISFHIVVAYGYAKYNNVDGYIVHCGWGETKHYAWIPESLIGFKIKMNVTHNHNLQYTGRMIQDIYRVLRCTTCGYEDLECVYQVNEEGNTIADVKHPLSENVTIPDEIYNKKINAISEYAFYQNQEIKNLTIPTTITSIGKYAFSNCSNLTTVNFLDDVNKIVGITNVAEGLFDGCSSLETVTFSHGIETIGKYTFYGCTKLKSVKLPYLLNNIDDYAFKNCQSLSNLKLPNSITNVGVEAFRGCTSLTSITLSTTLETIGDSAFEGCINLESIDFPKALVSIGNFTFKNCTKLSIVNMLNNVTFMGNSAFEGCIALENVTLSSSLWSIKQNTFKNCINLQAITFPFTARNIESSAFENCKKLITLKLSISLETIGESAFKGCKLFKNVTLPNSLKNNRFKCLYEL